VEVFSLGSVPRLYNSDPAASFLVRSHIERREQSVLISLSVSVRLITLFPCDSCYTLSNYYT
jgi:hypothetical protein